MLEPIKNSIIFVFEDEIRGGRFVEQTESGIYLGKDHQRDAQAPRWGRVISCGPDVKNVSNNDNILIEPSQWTFGMEYDGVKLWRTTEDKVLCTEQ
jgi:hypothetical protein